MIYPPIEKLTKDTYNRYELVIATAKAARIITDEINERKEEIDRTAGLKDLSPGDKIIQLQREPRDFPEEKPVKSAIFRIFDGEYVIITE